MSNSHERNVWRATSSRRGEVNGTFELRTDSLRIAIHGHLHHPGRWLVSCFDVGIQPQLLEALDEEEAKREGLVYVYGYLAKATDELRAAMFATEKEKA